MFLLVVVTFHSVAFVGIGLAWLALAGVQAVYQLFALIPEEIHLIETNI